MAGGLVKWLKGLGKGTDDVTESVARNADDVTESVVRNADDVAEGTARKSTDFADDTIDTKVFDDMAEAGARETAEDTTISATRDDITPVDPHADIRHLDDASQAKIIANRDELAAKAAAGKQGFTETTFGRIVTTGGLVIGTTVGLLGVDHMTTDPNDTSIAQDARATVKSMFGQRSETKSLQDDIMGAQQSPEVINNSMERNALIQLANIKTGQYISYYNTVADSNDELNTIPQNEAQNVSMAFTGAVEDTLTQYDITKDSSLVPQFVTALRVNIAEDLQQETGLSATQQQNVITGLTSDESTAGYTQMVRSRTWEITN